MTCPHCGNAHAAGTLFCPETGKPIAQEASPAQPDVGVQQAPGALRTAGFPGGGKHVEPKGIGDLLTQAFELYKTHFVVLVLTCGIVLVPLGLIGGLIGMRGRGDPAVAELQARNERVQAKVKELSALQKKMAAASPDERKEYAEQAAQLQKEVQDDAQAQMGAAVGLIGKFVGYLLLALLLIPLQIIATYLAQAALIPVIGDRALGGNMDFKQAWALVMKRLVPLLVTSILGGLAIGIGILFCVLPGLVLAFLFAFSAPVVMLEHKSGVEALKRSQQLVKNHWLEVLLVGLVYAVTIGVVSWLLQRILGATLGPLVHPFVSAALFPLPTLALVLLYLDLRRVDEGVTEAELHQRMVGELV